jgi:hypothetical protein
MPSSALTARTEILELNSKVRLSFKWIRRCSTVEHARAHALSKLAAGDTSDRILRKAGLTRYQMSHLIHGNEHAVEVNDVLYDKCSGEENVFMRLRHRRGHARSALSLGN